MRTLFLVRSLTFRQLYVFVLMKLDTREVIGWNVTEHPTDEWTAQQLRNALLDRDPPRFLLRDRDAIYGEAFRRRVKNMGIEQVVTAYRSPWQNPFVERIVGSIRRECLDHVIVLNENHLRRILTSYFAYYHESRTHLSLDRNSPTQRRTEPPSEGPVVAIGQVGGLHHRYTRAA